MLPGDKFPNIQRLCYLAGLPEIFSQLGRKSGGLTDNKYIPD